MGRNFDLSNNLSKIMNLEDVSSYSRWQDIITDADKEKVFRVISALKNFVDSLSVLEEPNLNFFNKDFVSLFTEACAVAKEKFPQWNDFRETNIGVFFLVMFSALFDKLFYMTDNMFNQYNIMTMNDTRAMYLKAMEFAYQLKTNEAATVDVTFQIPSAHSRAINIPDRTIVSTSDEGVVFETVQTGVINVGETYTTVEARNWTTSTVEYIAAGEKNEHFKMEVIDFVKSGTVVNVNGDEWEEVDDNFMSSIATDKHYFIRLIRDDLAYIVFGDGVNGSQLADGDIVNITYRNGGGETANYLPPGSISKIKYPIYDSENIVNSSVSVTNLSNPTGGLNADTIDDMRKNLSYEWKNLKRTVTLEDFEDNTMKYQGVRRALAMDRIVNPDITEDTVIVYFAHDSQGSDSGLPASIKAFIENNYPYCNDVELEVIEAGYVDIDVEMTVKFAKWTKEPDVIVDNIESDIESYFNYSNISKSTGKQSIDFGKRMSSIPLSLFVGMAEWYREYGVMSATVEYPTETISVDDTNIPVINSTTINWEYVE